MMTYAKKRGNRNRIEALNALMFLKLMGKDDALFDSIGAARSWVADNHYRVDHDLKGRKRTPDPNAEPEIEYIAEAVDAISGEETEFDTDVHEIMDEYDQLDMHPDMIADEPVFFLDTAEEIVVTSVEQSDEPRGTSTSTEKPVPPKYLGPSRINPDWIPKGVHIPG